jgi:hypothetical protein
MLIGTDDARLRTGCVTLAAAGALQLILAALRQPGWGIVVVLPVAIWVAWLWRPSAVQIAVVLLLLGLESILPLQTGGGRYFDWDLHYQMSRMLAFAHPTFVAGLANAENVLQRTPLFSALIASAVAHLPQYATFQAGSVLLNSLWMWPAGLLIERWGRPRNMVLAVVCCPMVIVFMLYTWPWGFCCFWLLSALYFADEEGRISWAGCGICLAAALMTHEGCIGYVVGLVAWLVVRRWDVRGLARALGSGLTACLALGVPWILVLLRYAPLSQIVRSPATAAGLGAGWLGGRLELIAATVIPLHGSPTVIDQLFVFLSGTVIGITAALLLTRTVRMPRGPTAWSIVGGLLGGVLLLQTGTASSGLYDTAFPAAVMLFTVSAAACPPRRWRGLAVVGLVIAALTATIIWIEAAFPSPSDPNLALKVNGHLQFIAGITVVPGLALIGSGLALGIVRTHDWWGAGLRPAQPRGEGPG